MDRKKSLKAEVIVFSFFKVHFLKKKNGFIFHVFQKFYFQKKYWKKTHMTAHVLGREQGLVAEKAWQPTCMAAGVFIGST